MNDLPTGFRQKSDPGAVIPPPGREMATRRSMVSNTGLAVVLAAIFLAGLVTVALVLFSAGGGADLNAATMFEVSKGPMGLRIKNVDTRSAGRVSVLVNGRWQGTMAVALDAGDNGVMPFTLLLDTDGLKFDSLTHGLNEVKVRSEGAIEWHKSSVR